MKTNYTKPEMDIFRFELEELITVSGGGATPGPATPGPTTPGPATPDPTTPGPAPTMPPFDALEDMGA